MLSPDEAGALCLVGASLFYAYDFLDPGSADRGADGANKLAEQVSGDGTFSVIYTWALRDIEIWSIFQVDHGTFGTDK